MEQSAQPSWFSSVQNPPRSVPHDGPRPLPVLFDAENRPITTREGWVRRRVELSTAWRAFLGTIPDPGLAREWKVVAEDRPPARFASS